MPEGVRFVVFLFMAILAYGGGHYYLYKWFNRLAKPSPHSRRILSLIIFLLAASFPIAEILNRYDSNRFSYLLTLLSSVWIGLLLYFILFASGSDLLRRLLRMIPFKIKMEVQRSLFYRRALVGCIIGAVLSIGAGGMQEAYNLKVTHLNLALAGLPPELNGFSMVQVTDVHYGMLINNGKLMKIVNRINELQPDVVLITGDLFDEGVSHMEEAAIPLSHIKSRQGVYAATGNHEFLAGIDRVTDIMREANIEVLRNRVRVLPSGLQLIGIDDPTGYEIMGDLPPDFNSILSGLDSHKPSILLYHPPTQFEKAALFGTTLQLSGHTHGGQIFPIQFFDRMIYPFTSGLHQLGDSFLYVSRGVGTWGPPMRVGSPPELVYIRLYAKK